MPVTVGPVRSPGHRWSKEPTDRHRREEEEEERLGVAFLT